MLELARQVKKSRRSFHFLDTYLSAFYTLGKGHISSENTSFSKNSNKNGNSGAHDKRDKQSGAFSDIKTFFFFAFLN